MTKRYDTNCPVGRVMNIIGDDWSVMILRDLFCAESCRFQDLADSLQGASPNTLSSRLKWLESQGVVERRYYSQHPPRASYALTNKGRRLDSVLMAMKEWGESYS